MRAIFKYPFKSTTVIAPRGNVLLVGYQGDGSELPTIWIDHTIGAADTEYYIRGTGEQPDEHVREEHIGSAICGRYVWHVFRRV